MLILLISFLCAFYYNWKQQRMFVNKRSNEFLFLIQAQLKTANKAGAIKMSTRCFAVLYLFDMYKGA